MCELPREILEDYEILDKRFDKVFKDYYSSEDIPECLKHDLMGISMLIENLGISIFEKYEVK